MKKLKYSVKMKLAIILFMIPCVLGYVEQYKGFNVCGIGGWSCIFRDGGFDVTYQCNATTDPSARVWAWTARLPSSAKSLTIRDCNHVEVHMDCTKGSRSNSLTLFKAVNISKLEFLQPLAPGIFLHDNDRIPQAPPTLHLEDIETTGFYPGLFDAPGGGCRYKSVKLNSIKLKNVKLEKLEKYSFQDQQLNIFEFEDVTINDLDPKAISLISNDSVNISNCKFGTLPPNAITIKGQRVSFTQNIFSKITTSGLTVKSKEFLFQQNNVTEVEQKGIDVLAAKIQLVENHWTHLNTGSFEKISPAYTPLDYEIPSKFIYNFSNNVIENVNPGSFHVNWEVYQNNCHDITTKNNVFDCSCTNFGWLSLASGLGPKITAAKGFYDKFLEHENNNICNRNNTCKIESVIEKIQDVCKNDSLIDLICKESINETEVFHPFQINDTSEDVSNRFGFSAYVTEIVETETTKNNSELITNNTVTLKISYIDHQHKEIIQSSSFTWLIIVVVILILAAISSVILFIWLKRKRNNQNVRTFYENHKGIEADTLVFDSEHHNVLYDKMSN